MACRITCGRGRYHLDFIFYLIKFSTPSPTALMLLTIWNWEHWKVLEEERQMLYVSSLFVCLMWLLLPFIMGTVEKLTFFFKVHFCVWNILLPCSPAGIFTLSSSLTLWCIPCTVTYTLFHLLSSKQEMAEKPSIFLLKPFTSLASPLGWVAFKTAKSLIVLSPC